MSVSYGKPPPILKYLRMKPSVWLFAFHTIDFFVEGEGKTWTDGRELHNSSDILCSDCESKDLEMKSGDTLPNTKAKSYKFLTYHNSNVTT